MRRQRGDGGGAAGHREAARDGWKPLTPITVKARDGKTDLYGFMFKPTGFDAAKQYPVIDHVYPGPQDGLMRQPEFAAAHGDMQALAELGFVVVCIDGMGTPERSKSFHDALYGDMGDNTIPDQVAGIKQLAAQLSVDRCGAGGDVWALGRRGGDGGGDVSLSRFLQGGRERERQPRQPRVRRRLGGEVDRAAAKNADGTSNYDSQANQNFAKELKGHLLLVHGTMDDNVPPNNTLLVVDALIKANKDFDLLMVPNAGHGYGDATPYVTRRRWDYFVRYLGGGVPPVEYTMMPYAEEQAALAAAGAQ